MDERLVSELEAVIADAGALAVRARKYRRGAGPDGAALEHEALALGATARRLNRRAALDPAAAAALLADARDLVARLRTLLKGIHDDPERRMAVAALAAGDGGALGRLLPHVFADLEAEPAPAALYQAVEWLRRGRRRPAGDVVAAVVALRDDGFPGEGDDLSPGADAELPAVTFAAAPPAEEPVVLMVETAALPLPALRLGATGEWLVHAVCLRVPFAVQLGDATASEQLRAEGTAADDARWRADLAAGLTAAGIVLTP